MKKFILGLMSILTTFFVSGSAFAVSIPSSMKQAMQHETAGMPSLLNLVVSMIIVIALIYVTGIIYTKLSQVNKDKLSLLNDKNSGENRFKVLDTLPMGQQRNLYALEINGKVLVVGSTPSHINLLKEFDTKTECSKFVESFQQSVESDSVKEVKKSMDIDELYKKYRN